MAEKEEKIYIEYFKDDPCKNCDVAEVGYCVDEDKGHGCLDKSNYIYGIPRQEAIERMAKALCADDVMREGYYQMAEAALNALLNNEK